MLNSRLPTLSTVTQCGVRLLPWETDQESECGLQGSETGDRTVTDLQTQLKLAMRLISSDSVTLVQELDALRTYSEDLERLLDTNEEELKRTRADLEHEVRHRWQEKVRLEAKVQTLEDDMNELRSRRSEQVAKPVRQKYQPKDSTLEGLTAENQLLREMLDSSQKSLSRLQRIMKR